MPVRAVGGSTCKFLDPLPVCVRFEQLFKQCVSSSAIKTKFEHHHKQGSEVILELAGLLEQEETQIIQNK